MVFPSNPIALEFLQKGRILAGTRMPFVSLEKKRQIFRKFVDSLSDSCFATYAQQLCETYWSKKGCRKHVNTEAQVIEFLKIAPRFEPHKDMVAESIRAKRQKYDLSI